MGSGANLYNPDQLEKIVDIHAGFEGTFDDNNEAAYVKARLAIISDYSDELLPEEAKQLALATRGWRKQDIIRAVDIYLSSGFIPEYCPPHNNTSDPRNGNWGENLLSIEAYTESPVLKSLADEIEILPSAEWAVFVEEDNKSVERRSEYYDLAGQSAMSALKRSPYYCLKAKIRD